MCELNSGVCSLSGARAFLFPNALSHFLCIPLLSTARFFECVKYVCAVPRETRPVSEWRKVRQRTTKFICPLNIDEQKLVLLLPQELGTEDAGKQSPVTVASPFCMLFSETDRTRAPACKMPLFSLQGERGPPGVNGTQGFQGCPGQRGVKVQYGFGVYKSQVRVCGEGRMQPLLCLGE